MKKKSEKSTNTYVYCRCLKCNKVVSISLTKIKAGQAKECVNCARENLKLGSDLVKISAVDGTSVLSLRKTKNNKNNTSGYNGVNLCKSGRYRANITFKRKQYHLGMYDTPEQAYEARKEAEKQIYGDFLKWYQDTYPERWNKIKNH